MSGLVPSLRRCRGTFGKILKKHDWVCEESQFQTYPKAEVDQLLLNKATLYENETYFLDNVKSCQKYIDRSKVYGENEYYVYESVCKMIRKPVRVIWALVPDYIAPVELQNLRGGLLPVHVLEGQDLFDVECVHPWATGIPKHFSRRVARRLRRIRFHGVKRNLCLAGYAYNYNMMCKPTGYMEREVLVYSEHAKKIFWVVIPDVPTSCACAYCKCTGGGRPGRPGPPGRGHRQNIPAVV
ncbi:uncharacterized protein LOC123552459 [Mercenaria mercenaria]|uniref:uncharacterized protein LOC123552459 n=1 Tax=Mercenaria mercenaria TaxID=6596 RepID=UPI00234FA1D3|nr:uncharacterized protein LOC123552459 [Mercenaria mercenaria]